MGESGRPRPGDALLGAARRVRPVKDGEYMLGRALHAEGDPGEAGLAQLRQAALVHALRVGLGRDLGTDGEAELGLDSGEDFAEVAGGQQCRRPAAEEHGAHRRRGGSQHLTRQSDLCHRKARVTVPGCPGAELHGGVGVEVAVAAPGGAERDMNIDSERNRAQLVERCRREPSIGRYGRAIGQCAWHGQLIRRSAIPSISRLAMCAG